MVGTRSRKRLAEPVEEPSAAVTLGTVLAAVDACCAAILEHAATVSTSQVLEMCRQELGLPDVAPLRLYRQAAKERALRLLEEQGQRPATACPPSAADLPLAVLVEVFGKLDHDSLCCALQCCRAWRATGSEPTVWQRLYTQRERTLAPQVPVVQQVEQREPVLQAQSPPPLPRDPKERYRQRYSCSCFDCFKRTSRSTLQAGSLRLRLCHECSQGYDSPRPHQRLVAASTAKRHYCLRDEDLALLPNCVESNPINPAWEPMHLYRRLDVRRMAVERWGSWELAAVERRRRLTRR